MENCNIAGRKMKQLNCSCHSYLNSKPEDDQPPTLIPHEKKIEQAYHMQIMTLSTLSKAARNSSYTVNSPMMPNTIIHISTLQRRACSESSDDWLFLSHCQVGNIPFDHSIYICYLGSNSPGEGNFLSHCPPSSSYVGQESFSCIMF